MILDYRQFQLKLNSVLNNVTIIVFPKERRDLFLTVWSKINSLDFSRLKNVTVPRTPIVSRSISRYCKKENMVASDNEKERERKRGRAVVFCGRWPHDSRDASATPYSFFVHLISGSLWRGAECLSEYPWP